MQLFSFPQTLFRSITDPGVYKEILTKTFRQSLGYFLIAYSLISISIAVYLGAVLAPAVFPPLKSNLDHLKSAYPSDTTLTIDQNGLSVAGDTPISISLKEPVPGLDVDNILIIDPDSIAEDIVDKRTLILLTAKASAFRIPGTEPAILTWGQSETNTVITSNSFKQQIDTTLQLISTIETFLIPLAFTSILVGLGLVRLLSALIYTLLTSAVGSLSRRPYPYRNYLNLSLHILPIAESITLIQSLLYGQTVATFFSLIFFGVSAIAIFSLPKPTILRLNKSRKS